MTGAVYIAQHGLKRRVRLDIFERDVDRSGGPDACWIWTGRLDRWGYGQYHSGPAHRVAYRIWVGPIEGDLTVDHLCFVRACVNPAHLRLLPLVENLRNQRSKLRTHCPKGHEFSDENTNTKAGTRVCRACNREASASWRRAGGTFIVTRRDYVRRSRIFLSCAGCGTTDIRCDIAAADAYEAKMREHVCYRVSFADRAPYDQEAAS